MTINAKDIIAATKKVTKEWTKQRKAEERGRRGVGSRAYVYSDRVNFTEVAHRILPAGYAKASGDGKYTVDKRQFYYACRDPFFEETGREITADYFSQTLLVKYMNQHPAETASWKITASPRGTLTIPNTGEDTRIPCGTIAIEDHLRDAATCCYADDIPRGIRKEWPSMAEGQRYQAVLYIEKEGFDPQLREAKIAERFDMAIVSCKGQSVVAARRFVDHVCRVNGGVPLFIAHDFDPSGFSIAARLTTVSDWAREQELIKYEFKNAINVIDLGLRLTDVEKYDLKSEAFKFRGMPGETNATPEERKFFQGGRRVELNAFSAPQFIEWLTTGIKTHLGSKRFVPADDDVLVKAYRRALAIAKINHAMRVAHENAIEEFADYEIDPADIRRKLESMQECYHGVGMPWDRTLYSMAGTKLFDGE